MSTHATSETAEPADIKKRLPRAEQALSPNPGSPPIVPITAGRTPFELTTPRKGAGAEPAILDEPVIIGDGSLSSGVPEEDASIRVCTSPIDVSTSTQPRYSQPPCAQGQDSYSIAGPLEVEVSLNMCEPPVNAVSAELGDAEVPPLFTGGHQFSITVDRSSSDRPLGIQYSDSDGVSLVIANMMPGLFYQSMMKHDSACWVFPSDRIIEVNGVRGDSALLERECQQRKLLHMKLYRHAPQVDDLRCCLSQDPVVVVHVYDLQGLGNRCISCASRALNSVSTKYGLFHTGVEVYGREWYFGYTPDYFHGLHAMEPKQHPQHSYRMSLVMGHTEMTCAEFEEQMPVIRIAWPSFTYDVRRRNCHTFTNFLCQMLGFPSGPKFGLYGSGDAKLAHAGRDMWRSRK